MLRRFPMLLALAFAAAGAAWAGEPFLTRNESPVSRLYGLPAGDDAAPELAGYEILKSLSCIRGASS